MNDCLFCKISSGEIPSKTIYEDELVKVFLDINPVSDGHCLIIPKKHYENFIDVDSDILIHSKEVANKIYEMLKDKLDIDGLTIVQNNFYGQEVKHYHIHLIPRYKDDHIEMKRQENKLDVDEILSKIIKK